ncbi:MAG: hypothetical protein HYU27_06250 [Acidobacteria bacterium]|nr:hypothetical protein [Acidobacteriota bacterium]
MTETPNNRSDLDFPGFDRESVFYKAAQHARSEFAEVDTPDPAVRWARLPNGIKNQQSMEGRSIAVV